MASNQPAAASIERVVDPSRLEPPRVDPVGLIERPAGYSARPRSHSLPVRLAAAALLGAFLVVGVATTVASLGAWCLTSAAGTPFPFPP